MYDLLAEAFVYVFALLYVILFAVLAQSWIRSVLSRKGKSRPRRAAG
jgi:hypothetical protein